MPQDRRPQAKPKSAQRFAQRFGGRTNSVDARTGTGTAARRTGEPVHCDSGTVAIVNSFGRRQPDGQGLQFGRGDAGHLTQTQNGQWQADSIKLSGIRF
jgi:hypothetical protein